MNTTLVTAMNAVTDGAGTESVTDKVFIASSTEMGVETGTGGTAFTYFSSNTLRIGYPTAEAVQNSDYTNSSLNPSAGWHWWLRNPRPSTSCIVRYINTTGVFSSYDNVYEGYRGVRPLCNLPSDILVSDTPDTDGAYTIIWNQTSSDTQALSALTNGSLVKDTGSTYYGVPIIWRVIDKNHTGYPANSVTLITDKIIKIAGFDGKESGNADSNRAAYGNN
jgi:hypothetical protein